MDKRQLFSIVLGQVIKQLRTARGMTQADLAAKAGIASGTLSRYENGQEIWLYDVLTLMDLLDKSPMQFLKLVHKAMTRTLTITRQVSRRGEISSPTAMAGLAILGVVQVLTK